MSFPKRCLDSLITNRDVAILYSIARIKLTLNIIYTP